MSAENHELLLEAKHITKQFRTPGGRLLTACSDLNLQLYRGQTLGIVGESGCGKSTFVKMIAQMFPPTEGEILLQGRDITKLKGERARQNRRHIQMVFQDPNEAFNPKMRVWEAITEPLMNLKLIRRSERRAKARELLAQVELPPEFCDRYPHSMSGGQRQRLGIARALAPNPDIIICDEATSALDVSIQRTVVELLVRLQREKGLSYIFICHDPALVYTLSHQIAVMYLGHVVEILPGGQMQGHAAHPYTQALLSAMFGLQMDFTQPIECIESEAASAVDLPPCCPFWNRCDRCSDVCRSRRPPLQQIAPGHLVACHAIAAVGQLRS